MTTRGCVYSTELSSTTVPFRPSPSSDLDLVSSSVTDLCFSASYSFLLSSQFPPAVLKLSPFLRFVHFPLSRFKQAPSWETTIPQQFYHDGLRSPLCGTSTQGQTWEGTAEPARLLNHLSSIL
jgi:hypothetical protein